MTKRFLSWVAIWILVLALWGGVIYAALHLIGRI